jgi:glycosyltransferase involved in cell wall biosynthesis
MSDQPLVSVFVPTYNQVGFVDEAIASAIAQDYDPLEIVVPDDGSTDGTVEAILRWAERYPDRIVPLVNLPHVGVTENCNRGLRACRGKYIAFTAGDDVLLPGKISAQVRWMEAADDRVLCGHDVEMFDSDTGRRLWLWSEGGPLKSGVGAEGVVAWPPFAGTSIMVRASVLPPHGYDQRLGICSDARLWVDCLRNGGRYGYIEGVWARYRRHGGNISNLEKPEKALAMWTDMLTHYSLVAADYPELAPVCRKSRARLSLTIAQTYIRGHDYGRAKGSLADAVAAWSGIPRTLAHSVVRLIPPSALALMFQATTRVREQLRSTRVGHVSSTT